VHLSRYIHELEEQARSLESDSDSARVEDGPVVYELDPRRELAPTMVNTGPLETGTTTCNETSVVHDKAPRFIEGNGLRFVIYIFIIRYFARWHCG
jgi:hypothetical protein